MIITYLRSSSYGCHDMCPMKYFLEYNLGWRGPSNIKAEKGTVVHKVLEVLAIIKLKQQENRTYFNDDILGRVYVDKYDLDDIIERCTEYYSSHSIHEWKPLDKKHCRAWTYKAIEYNNGEYDPRNSEIVQPEQSFDITIAKPWAEYEYVLHNGQALTGNFGIKGTIDQISKIDDETYRILDWKGLPIETPLPTPDGWTTMGEIEVGDFVFDKLGNQTKVIGKSNRKFLPCYRITFDDTTTVECDNEHLWSLENGDTVKITDLKIGDKIPVAKTIKLQEKDLPVDPYLLGVWLGDGRNRSCEITSNDPFIFEEIKRRGYDLGQNQEKRGSNNLESRTVLNVTPKLRKLNLLNNKHIPDLYLRASEHQRIDLLRGLMDSDGNVNKVRKQAVFTTCNKRLSDDVKELLLSLGQRPNQANITRSTNFVDAVDIYPLAFRPIFLQPFLLPRKADQLDLTWGCGNSKRRLIKKIELIEEKITQCIMVDSPTSTYLCTENMIPTHNTGRRLNWATGEEKTWEKLNVDPQLMMYYYAIQHLYPEIEHFELVIYFINDGGPFTLCFSREDLPTIENMLKEKFLEIKNTEMPPLKKSWKCTKFCHFGRTTFDGTSVLPIIEQRDYQVTPKGQYMTKCEQTKYALEHRSLDSVMKHMTVPGHTIDYYQAPGAIE